MSNFEEAVNIFSQALTQLERALEQPDTEFIRDSAIQRFEFTLDLAWKATKAYLKDLHGIECNSPKSCFREAFSVGLITYSDQWIVLVDKRNETSHTYNQKVAAEIYSFLPTTLPLFKSLLAKLQN